MSTTNFRFKEIDYKKILDGPANDRLLKRELIFYPNNLDTLDNSKLVSLFNNSKLEYYKNYLLLETGNYVKIEKLLSDPQGDNPFLSINILCKQKDGLVSERDIELMLDFLNSNIN